MFAAAPASGTLTIAGYTKIGSKQRNRRYRRETITLGTETTYESKYYYVSDTAGTPNATPAPTITASNVGTTGNAAFTLDPELYTQTFTIQANDEQFKGWSAQGLVGGEPRTAFDVVPSLWNINATPTGVSFEMQCPAGEVTLKRTIQGGDITEPFLDADYTDASPTRFGGWSGAFRYGTDLVKMTNLAIAFNRNLNPDEAVDGDRFSTDVEASDNRIITVTPTTRFRSSYEKTATVDNWQEVFRERTRRALEGRWYHYTGRRAETADCFQLPKLLDCGESADGWVVPLRLTKR